MSTETKAALSDVIAAAKNRLEQDEAGQQAAFALACCRWHHAHPGGAPIPCVGSTSEAQALIGLLEHAGYRLRRVRRV
jgi:hypothetical protein